MLDFLSVGCFDALDGSAETLQLADDVFITALHIVDVFHHGGVAGHKSGHDHGSAGAKVKCLHAAAMQRIDTIDHGDLGVHLNVGAHAV